MTEITTTSRITGNIAYQPYDFAVIKSDVTGAEIGGVCSSYGDGRATIDLGGMKITGECLRFVPASKAVA